MIRTVELAYNSRTGVIEVVNSTANNFSSLTWTASAPVTTNGQITFDLTTRGGPWDQLTFTMHVFGNALINNPSASNLAKFDVALWNYRWQSSDPEAKLEFDWEVKKNGTSLGGVQSVVYDHFDGDFYHDPLLIP